MTSDNKPSSYQQQLSDSLALPVYRERSWNVWTEKQHREWKAFLLIAKIRP